MDEIRPLFRQGIVEPFTATLEEFEGEARRDRAMFLRLHADGFRPITDTAQGISHWRRWNKFRPDTLPTAHASSKSTGTPLPAPSKGSKVGRNEPGPCGSGKKYKKCCAGCRDDHLACCLPPFARSLGPDLTGPKAYLISVPSRPEFLAYLMAIASNTMTPRLTCPSHLAGLGVPRRSPHPSSFYSFRECQVTSVLTVLNLDPF
jgi:hypothetical protein